jgi:hypothetical protein
MEANRDGSRTSFVAGHPMVSALSEHVCVMALCPAFSRWLDRELSIQKWNKSFTLL